MGPRRPIFFDPDWYLEVHPDVADAGMAPLRHYLRHGRFEGRRPCPLIAADRERDLRLGLLAEGEAALAALAESGPPAERTWAAVALARRLAWRDDWAAADAVLARIPAERLVAGFGMADPALLAIEAALVAGAPARAAALLALARRRLGPLSDLRLAAANLAAAGQGFGGAWRRALAGLYLRAGLPGPGLAPARPGLAAFDRLRPGWPPLPPRRGGPLISVIVPARNAAATIATALASLSAQSWRRLEILVVDNGSTDATAAVVRAHAAADPRIRLIDGAAAPGAYAARNLGLAAARGEFITSHDADDWSHPARIARQVAALLADPAAAASVAHWVRVTPGLRFTRWWGDDGLVHRNVSSLMIRRDAIVALGFWDRVRVGADTEYADRLIAAFGPRALCDVSPGLPLSFGRRTDGSLSRAGPAAIATGIGAPRRLYHEAARVWHAAAGPAGLHLAERPARRPFAAPPELEVGDPPPLPSDLDRLRASPLCDARWRLAAYPALRLRGADPAAQYLAEGAALGQDPGPEFSTTGYLLSHDPGDENPLLHHLARGGGPVLPDLAGALPAPPGAPRVLVVGHLAGARVFGAERSLLDLLDRIAAAGRVPLAVLPAAGNAGYLAEVRARCHRLHIRPYGWLYGGLAPHPRVLAHLVGLIRGQDVAEVHQNTLVLDAPMAAARAAGVPVTVHVRELPAGDPGLCRDLGVTAEDLRARLLAGADRLVANSAAVARWLAPGPAGPPVTVLPNRIDPALFDLGFAPADPPRIALIGSLTPRKGLADCLALARGFARIGGRGRFVLVGPGSAELDRLRPLPANVSHAGYAETPAAALAQADLVLSLSRVAESFGRSVAEALAAGRPVLCWDRGTPPDLVGRGEGAGGRVVAAGDIAAAARALAAMTADPVRLAALSAAARARARHLAEARDGVPDAALFGPVRRAGQGPGPGE